MRVFTSPSIAAALPGYVIPLIVVVVILLVLAVLFRGMWRVAEPNQALIISGLRKAKDSGSTGEQLGFRIVTGSGVLVIPGVQRVRSLSLDMQTSDLTVECVTHQGIPVNVKGTVLYKVGDDHGSIASAARRFLDQQAGLKDRVHNVFAGHLRTIIGGLTVEQLIRERNTLTEQTRQASGDEMGKLGLIIDSMQIQEIDDPTGYIKNLAAPHQANIARDARIAQATAGQEAIQAEQAAIAANSERERDTQIAQASFRADVERTKAEADQAGPLAEAVARQGVVEAATRTAQLEAQRVEQELEATVRRPADAHAYAAAKSAEGERDARIAQATAGRREVEEAAAGEAKRVELEALAKAEATKITGDANAHATQVTGEAEGKAIEARGTAEGIAIKARGEAEGAAIKARAEGLATQSEAVIGQQLVEKLPEVVAAAAGAFAGVDNFTVLNGAEGVGQALMSVIATAVSGVQAVRGMMPKTTPAQPAAAAGIDSSEEHDNG